MALRASDYVRMWRMGLCKSSRLGMDDAKADCVFRILDATATHGARCPTNESIAGQLRSEGIEVWAGTIPGIVSQLARDGRIVVRIYSHNYRETVICGGGRPQGKGTLPPPDGRKPYRVVGCLA
jgi:hypothetical protein